MIKYILILILLFLIVGCALRDEYEVECEGCGTVYMSTSPAPIKECPNCPLEFCPEAMEILNGNNDMEVLFKHTQNCPKCNLKK